MIPDWLREKLASPPAAGSGIHAWLFSVARQLHAHMPPSAVGAALQAATAAAARRVTEREIRDAVNNSREVAWTRRESGISGGARRSNHTLPRRVACAAADSGRWPNANENLRLCQIARSAKRGVAGVYDLQVLHDGAAWEQWTADDWMDALFPDAEWLCLAVDHPATARSRRREKWTFGPADMCGLVVPSPMTGPSGRGLDGRTSHRCLGNTGQRQWLVIEFDKLSDGKPMSADDQVALHWHLKAAAEAMDWPRLVLVVNSAGKSVHGWYGPVTAEADARALMEYAVLLGADPATWNRCQLIRLPAGRRAVPKVAYSLPDDWPSVEPTGWARQAVYFFDESLCNPMNTKFTQPGERPASHQPSALKATS